MVHELLSLPVPLPFEGFVRTGQLGPPPTPQEAVVLWGILSVASLGPSVVCRLLPGRIRPWLARRRVPGQRLALRLSPSIYYCRIIPHREAGYWRNLRYVWNLERLAGHWDLVGLTMLDSLAEELVYRGLPILGALALGLSPMGPVVVGTVVWAALHGLDEMGSHLVTGALFAWLWLTGAWMVAIALHLGGNLLAHGLLRLLYRSHIRDSATTNGWT